MAGRIQGITVEIGGDTTKLQTALKGVNTEMTCWDLWINSGLKKRICSAFQMAGISPWFLQSSIRTV